MNSWKKLVHKHKIKRASSTVNELRKQIKQSLDYWRKDGNTEDLDKANELKSQLKKVMMDSLKELQSESPVVERPAVIYGEDKEKKERERTRLLERIKDQEGEKRLKSARRLEKLNSYLD